MYHTPALVLLKREWKDHDWIVTFSTEKFGKVTALAQGSRRHGAKLQGHFEPGVITDVSFVAGRAGYRLVQAHLKEWFPKISTSLDRISARASILAMVDRNLFQEGGPGGEGFFLAREALRALQESGDHDHVRAIPFWFLARFLDTLGFFPEAGSPEGTIAAKLANFLTMPVKEARLGEADAPRLMRDITMLAGRIGRDSISVILPSVTRTVSDIS